MSSSAICAADILEAWLENDREQLIRKLAKGAAPDVDPRGNSHECERLELLDGIAAQIRCSIASGQVQDARCIYPSAAASRKNLRARLSNRNTLL